MGLSSNTVLRYSFGLAIGFAVLAVAVALSVEPLPPQGIREGDAVARAIGTPPWPVPNWLAFLYPWQTLASAALALIAALVGASAIVAQAHATLIGVRDQIAGAKDVSEKQFSVENERIVEDRMYAIRRVAGGLSGELRPLILHYRRLQLIDQFRAAKITAEGGTPPIIPVPSIYSTEFPVFSALCGDIGLLPRRTPHDVATVYGALRNFHDCLKGIRAGEYSFLNEPFSADGNVMIKQAEGRAERALYGLEIIYDQLVIIDDLGEQLLRDLDNIAENPMPELP